ncbi:MAG: Serine/threonine-protein kinase AfsK [Planctomycetota bacterium]|jgi:outer membrane protein assembly factor BamB
MMLLRTLSAVIVCSALAAADPPAGAVAEAWPAPDGLVVQIGAESAQALGDFTGRDHGRLVHGLTADDAVRDRLRGELHAAGLHPLASVATWHGAPRLPYADRLVNLVVLDRDALGAVAPDEDEVRRVVAPGGAILHRRGGIWSVVRVPRPDTFGDWTHYDGDAAGSSVSTDRAMTGIRSWQWIDNFRDLRWEKTGPKGGDEGNIRISGRYAVWDYSENGKNIGESSRERGPVADVHAIVCRDVSNGLPVWRRDIAGGTRGSRRALAVDQGMVLTWLDNGGPLTALDLATGTTLRTYAGSELKPLSYEEAGKARSVPLRDSCWVRIAGTTVLANGDGALRAWSLDGTPLWTLRRDGERIDLPVVDAAGGTVYALAVADRPVNLGDGRIGIGTYWGRWPASEAVNALLAIELSTGKLRWENREIASRDLGINDPKKRRQLVSGYGQVLIAGPHIVLVGNDSIAGGMAAMVASVDRSSGKTVHNDPRTLMKSVRPNGEVEWHGFKYQSLFRDGRVYIMGASSILGYDPASNAVTPLLDLAWNARCVRPVATPGFFVMSQTAFIGPDMSGEMVAVARSGCAQSPTPGAGLLLFGPHMCACTTHFDGFLAMAPGPMRAALPDGLRLVRPAAPPAPAPAAAPLPASPVAAAWPWFTISVSVRPATVEAGGWSFAIDPQRQRVDAKGPGGTTWSWVGDARLGTSVVVADGVAVIGSHDGWVTGLDLGTGAPRWRHLVAPDHRLVVANGMLTSAWPVFGVADLGGGLVVASAGTHAELDGGIRVAALRATDGSAAWTKVIAKTRSVITPGGRGSRIADRSVINTAPTVAEGRIIITGGAHLGRLEFAPDEEAAAISARISEPPAKKR